MVSTPACRKVEAAGSILGLTPWEALRSATAIRGRSSYNSALPMRGPTKININPPPRKYNHKRLRSDPNPSRENDNRNKRAEIYSIIMNCVRD
jgi:hypothetical protein